MKTYNYECYFDWSKEVLEVTTRCTNKTYVVRNLINNHTKFVTDKFEKLPIKWQKIILLENLP